MPGPPGSISMALKKRLELERVAVPVQGFAYRVYHEVGSKANWVWSEALPCGLCCIFGVSIIRRAYQG